MYKEFEDKVKKAQAEVPRTDPVKGEPPYPVYRPSKGEFVWVNTLNDVVFVSLGEKFLAKADQIIQDQDNFGRMSWLNRLFYSGHK